MAFLPGRERETRESAREGREGRMPVISGVMSLAPKGRTRSSDDRGDAATSTEVSCTWLQSFLGSGPEGVDDLCFHTYGEFSPSSPGSKIWQKYGKIW